MLSTDFLPGAPCWLDVSTPDVAASAAFYTGLLDWRTVSLGPELLCQVEGRTVAAIRRAATPTATPQWLIYFQTDDADAVAKTIDQAGGTILAAPRDVGAQGRTAVFTDPAGASFAVWQPGGTAGLGLVTEAGSLGWAELYAPDPARLRAFYESVFGWRVEDMPMGETPYPVISPADGDERSAMAGLVPSEPGDPAHWLPYFEVAGCDATVARAQVLGGTVRAPATTVGGVGRMAFLDDPFGARFAIITSSV
ncbi:VOC family protein [Nonomuraea sp. NPDC002799]